MNTDEMGDKKQKKSKLVKVLIWYNAS